ncbi:serine hydrolase domain-containing protein [Pseudomonas tolaasii]|uniref:serine hydrolase domain-containing protein n=1 Tax=Pseudomonas tolaasii TaxID=29442 RepID=UPI0002D7F3BD|nr:serine hydrolase domain-containing protein [Pseudomonas tolaasii]MBW1246415.1 beta-lactamase family protein [Pseudomonas tolaasii]NVZ44699.1 beta-lactamase family protein [Pseudomonas tolaasii]NWA47560.1 beta-lactamase family protein [Pseudomonas tolaasii]QXQ17046.1 beta-lactamase family protein [Pseudomonas tolaasii]WLH50184.1 serine hydrolase [Pseudomonas tolaasii]
MPALPRPLSRFKHHPLHALMCASTLALSLAACATQPDAAKPYPHAQEPIGDVQAIYDGRLSEALAVTTFRNTDRLFPVRTIKAGGHPFPLPRSSQPLAPVAFDFKGKHYTLDDYVATNRVTGLLVLKDGKIVDERYEKGNTPQTRWMSMSVAKSVTSTLVGAALQDGSIKSLDDKVTRYLPALAGSAYDQVTVRQILAMRSGVKWNEQYTDPSSDERHLIQLRSEQVPGSLLKFMASLSTAAPPGTRTNYSTGETQVLGQLVSAAVGKPLTQYLSEKIWGPYGMQTDAKWWLDGPNGNEVGGSGISATLEDYGRFGQFVLSGGVAAGQPILPKGWLSFASATTGSDAAYGDFGSMWWPGWTDASRADKAFTAAGTFGQYVYINPTKNVVIVVWQAQTQPTGGKIIDDMVAFDAIAKVLP